MEKINLTAGQSGKLVDYVDAKRASVTVEGTARVADDGTVANADCGHKMSDGSFLLTNHGEIKNLTVYAITDTVIQASYLQ